LVEKYQKMQGFQSNTICVHQAEHQGYTIHKPGLMFGEQVYKYTEDTGTIFETTINEKTFTVSSVCDGHAGYMTSFFTTSIIEKEFNKAIAETEGDVEKALALLFENIGKEMLKMELHLRGSGSTCNVTVFDSTNARVYVASLGDSPTLKYVKNNQNRYVLDWRSQDQDCADPLEVERMVAVHIENGDINATPSSVVYEVEVNGNKTGVWRNKKSEMMLHSSFGDFPRDYYPGIVNIVPRIWSCEWGNSDVWIQCSDGLMEWLSYKSRSIQPRTEFRVEEIAQHLDICAGDENIAHRLHELQINSMVEAKEKAFPGESHSTREWVEANFDNHITKVFTKKFAHVDDDNKLID